VVAVVLTPLGMVTLVRWASPVKAKHCFGWFLVALTLVYSVTVFRFGAWAPRYFAVLLVLYSLFATVAITVGLSACMRVVGWHHLDCLRKPPQLDHRDAAMARHSLAAGKNLCR
jgi:hypothetical protein